MEKEEGEKELGKKHYTLMRKYIHMHPERQYSLKLLRFCSADWKATWIEASDQSKVKVIELSAG